MNHVRFSFTLILFKQKLVSEYIAWQKNNFPIGGYLLVESYGTLIKLNCNQNHVIIFLFVVTIIVRILGHRVAELEKKLKTLEVSGLWSLQGLYLIVNIN